MRMTTLNKIMNIRIGQLSDLLQFTLSTVSPLYVFTLPM